MDRETRMTQTIFFLTLFFFSIAEMSADNNYVPWATLSPEKTVNNSSGLRYHVSLTANNHKTCPTFNSNALPRSPQEWEYYFAINHMSQEAILDASNMLLNKNYREVAKKLPLYATYIKKYAQQYDRYSGWQKMGDWLSGAHERDRARKFASLYQECLQEETRRAQEEKKRKTAAKKAAKREQEAHELAIYKDLRSQVNNQLTYNNTAAYTRQQNRLKAIDQTLKGRAARSSRRPDYNPNICPFAKLYNISKTTLNGGAMNSYQYQLHNEFLEQLAVATGLHDRYQEDSVKIFLEAVGHSSAQGFLAIENNQSATATNWADVGWQALDLVIAAGEGVCLGGYNSALFAADAIIFTGKAIVDPIHAGKKIYRGIATITDLLARATGTMANLAYLEIQGDHDQVCSQLHSLVSALDSLIDHCSKKLNNMPNRDKVKYAAALTTEMVLQAKAFKAVLHISSRMRPMVVEYIQAMRKEEVIVELAGTGERMLFQAAEAAQQVGGSVARVVSDTEKALTSFHADLMKKLEPEITVLRAIFDNKKKGFAEFSNKYIKLPYEHFLGMELSFNEKGALAFHGFHHDFMNAIEKSGMIQFMNKKIGKAGFYSADIFINGKFVKEKTFFPSHWKREEVVQAIYEAYDHAIQKGIIPKLRADGKYLLSGLTKDGVEVEMFITRKGRIVTAYPCL